MSSDDEVDVCDSSSVAINAIDDISYGYSIPPSPNYYDILTEPTNSDDANDASIHTSSQPLHTFIEETKFTVPVIQNQPSKAKTIRWRDKMLQKRKQRKQKQRIAKEARRAEDHTRNLLALKKVLVERGIDNTKRNTTPEQPEPMQPSSILRRRGKREKWPKNDDAAVLHASEAHHNAKNDGNEKGLVSKSHTALMSAHRTSETAARPPLSPLQRLKQQLSSVAHHVTNSISNAAKHYAIIDSGASGHFGTVNGGMEPTNKPSSKVVSAADGQSMPATSQAMLPQTQLRDEARQADIIPGIMHNLMSVGKLADSGYITVFHPGSQGVEVYDSNATTVTTTGAPPVLRGCRDEVGLYQVPLTNDANANNNNILHQQTTKQAAYNLFELPSIERAIRYMHSCAGFPTKATWIKAIRNGNYVSWPLLTVENVNKYYPETDATPMGHLNQQRQGVRSTKQKKKKQVNLPPIEDIEEVDTSSLVGKKEHDVYIKVYDLRGTVYSDQTGKFPYRSKRGYQYIMVMIHIDSNHIFVEPLKSRTSAEMQRAYLVLINRVKKTGMEIKKHVLDNEVSNDMKELIEETCKYELVPPGCHRRNVAEVAIKIFKNHFISILAGLDPSCPLYLWDRFLPQAELTCNLLRQSNTVPTVSAHAHVHGPFDYMRTPLAPLGCPCQVHEQPSSRGTYAPHCISGFNLGTSDEHYRCWICYIPETGAERVSETVFFKHKYITNPTLSHGDMVIKAAHDLAKVLQKKSSKKEDDTIRSLRELSKIFTDMAASEDTTTWETEYVPKPSIVPQRKPTVAPRVNPIPEASYRLPIASSPRVETNSIPSTPSQSPSLNVDTTTVEFDSTAEPFSNDDDISQNNNNTPPSTPLGRLAESFKSESPTPVSDNKNDTITSPKRTRDLKALRGGTLKDKAAGTHDSKFYEDLKNLPAKRTRTVRSNDVANWCQASDDDQAERSEFLANQLFALNTMDSTYLTPNKSIKLKQSSSKLNALALAVQESGTGKQLNYRELRRHPEYQDDWNLSSANEFGRLAQGVGGRVKGTNTIFFIHKSQVPADRMKDVTYGKFVCTVRPEKADPNRTRLTVGGNRINYPGEVGTPTAEMMLAKILFNSVISTKGARFMTMDIKNFYLGTPMKRFEYLKLKLSDIPQEIIDEYNLMEKVTPDEYVYVEIRRGMYGLPQGGLLAQEQLEKHLNKEGYFQDQYIPGLWTHKTRPIQFTLVVDDFGVKYTGREHAEHLLKVLRQHYEAVTDDWTGGRYLGIFLDWDYNGKKVHLTMPGYIEKALAQFDHPRPQRKQDQPYPHTPPKYGATTQYAEAPDDSPLLDEKGKKYIQQVTGKFQYYGRAVDPTLLTPLSALAAQQSNPTENTMKYCKQFLDYVASQEEAVLTYHASDMKLASHSDAGYLNERNARSRAGGHFFLSNDDTFPPLNGSILNIAQVIKAVMTSAAEAELGALYINAREAVYIRLILERMGHPQPPTPIQTDNSTAEGVINSKVQPKRTKAMDMRFHWLRDRETLKQFRFYWRPGKLNIADYWTKHHPASHHKHMRPEILTPQSELQLLRQKLSDKVMYLSVVQVSTYNLTETTVHSRDSESSSARVC